MSDKSQSEIHYGCLFRDVEDYLRKWINGGMTDKRYTEQMLQLLNVHRDGRRKEDREKIRSKKLPKNLTLSESLGVLFGRENIK